ncbi:hypothetical protein SDJN02_18431, partial [Cucurbita argyrosperma subsp. argyrosperma]
MVNSSITVHSGRLRGSEQESRKEHGAGFHCSITALRQESCVKIRRNKEYMQAFPKFLIASPSFHGGRGALPSAGGHPADLTFLAGGGY